ncbi:MAG: hypothetical protein KDD91_15260, partial [Caldilinea sp.]|nr:hypothetical protein [Caldilinea sp.]
MLQRWSIAIVRCRQGVRWRALCCALGLLLLSAGQMHARDGVAQEQPPFAPPTPARFERLGLEDGLSQNAVLAMLQDRHGFLWFGTQDGLNRYDGYTFVVYKNDPDDSNSLSLNSVLALHEDDDGTLWIGTWGGGLNHFDPQSNLWLRYRHDEADPASLCGDTVTALLDDGAGTLWVGTNEGGLCAFDRESRTFTPYRHHSADSSSIASNAISVLALDGDGSLWVGTGGFGIPGAGLDRFDPQRGEFRHFRHDVLDNKSLSNNTISAVLPNADGTLWVGTGGFSLSGAGLNHFDPATGSAVRYQHDPADPASLASDDVIDLYRDSAGDLWIGTWGGGVDRLPKQEGTASFVHHR